MGQAHHIDPAAGTVRGIQTAHHIGHALTGNTVPFDDQTIGPLISDNGYRPFLGLAATGSGLRGQGLEHLYHIPGKGMLQLDHQHILGLGIIQIGNNGFHPADIVQVITDDQGIGRPHCSQMAILGNQGPQYRHQLFHRRVFHRNHPGDQLFAARLALVHQWQVALLGGGVGNNLDDVAGGHRSITMHLQHRQKQLVHFRGRQGLGGHHRHVPGAHPRVHHEIFTGHVSDLADEGLDIRIADVHCPALAIVTGFNLGVCRQHCH